MWVLQPAASRRAIQSGRSFVQIPSPEAPFQHHSWGLILRFRTNFSTLGSGRSCEAISPEAEARGVSNCPGFYSVERFLFVLLRTGFLFGVGPAWIKPGLGWTESRAGPDGRGVPVSAVFVAGSTEFWLGVATCGVCSAEFGLVSATSRAVLAACVCSKVARILANSGGFRPKLGWGRPSGLGRTWLWARSLLGRGGVGQSWDRPLSGCSRPKLGSLGRLRPKMC